MYRVRFLKIIFLCLWRKPYGLLERYDLNFRVLPLVDTDVTRLFTQAYSAYMGLARWHYVFSSEFKTAALKNRWVPVTTAETIRYVRSIKAFEKVTLQTQLICWDDRRFFLKHSFTVKNEVRATAMVEGLLRGPRGHLNPIEIFKVLGVATPSPQMPKEISDWRDARF